MNALNKLGMLPWIAAIALFMQTLDATILNTAIPAIARSLDHSPLAMQGAIISYTLTIAMLIPISGWLADRFGTRRIFIYAVVLFTTGSLFCALSQSLTQLIMSRVIQAMGGAMMMPVARLSLLRAYPRNQLLPVLNFVTIPGLIGPVVGPLLGGIFVTYLSWHWIFIINIPIGLFGILCAKRYMPNFTLPKRSFDFIGFILFSGGLVCLAGAIESFGDLAASPIFSVLILMLGLLLLFAYIRHSKSKLQPFVNLNLFKIRTFTIGLLGNLASRLGAGCVPFLVPLMIQVGFNYSPLVAGFMMVPTALGFIFAKYLVTLVLGRLGYRTTLMLATMMIGVMISLFFFQTPTTPIVLYFLPLFILGTLMSTQFTAINTLALGYLNDEMASTGNSILAVAQQLSITLGVSASAIVLRFYDAQFVDSRIDSFHYTFLTMGCITLLSAWVFSHLKRHDGDELLAKK